MSTRLITLTVAAARRQVFNYLANIENLPVWTGGFCEWIELHREGWWAYTALGELEVETKADDISGEIDLRFRQNNGSLIVIPLRVRSDGEAGALVSLVCRQEAGLGDEQFERFVDSLLSGLRHFAELMPATSGTAFVEPLAS